MKNKLFAVLAFALTLFLNIASHAEKKSTRMPVPTVITTNHIMVDTKTVWYGVYTPSAPGGMVGFIASHDGTLSSLWIVINDHTVYEWSAAPGPGERARNQVSIDLKVWQQFFRKEVALRPFTIAPREGK